MLCHCSRRSGFHGKADHAHAADGCVTAEKTSDCRVPRHVGARALTEMLPNERRLIQHYVIFSTPILFSLKPKETKPTPCVTYVCDYCHTNDALTNDRLHSNVELKRIWLYLSVVSQPLKRCRDFMPQNKREQNLLPKRHPPAVLFRYLVAGPQGFSTQSLYSNCVYGVANGGYTAY